MCFEKDVTNEDKWERAMKTIFIALALAVGAMRSLIFFPAAPPLLLKTFIKFGVCLSGLAKNFA